MITATAEIVITCTTYQEVLMAKNKLLLANMIIEDTENPLVFIARMTQVINTMEGI